MGAVSESRNLKTAKGLNPLLASTNGKLAATSTKKRSLFLAKTVPANTQ